MGDRLELKLLGEVGSAMISMTSLITDWGQQSTCEDWDLGQLADHIAGGNWFTCAILDGKPADVALRQAQEGFADGYDRCAAVSTSTNEQLRAFAEPAGLDRLVDHIAGPKVGRAALTMRLHDLIIHTWDIGETLNPGFELNDNFVRWSLADLVDPESETAVVLGLDPSPSHGSDLSPHNHLLSMFGRTR